MQILVRLAESPEAYIREKRHASVKPPVCCPNCQSATQLKALGYYERGIASSGRQPYLRFLVRRFRCAECRRTTSVLPDFSQPYRLLSNQIISECFSGKFTTLFQKWDFLLNRYWERFTEWLPLLLLKVQEDFQLVIPEDDPKHAWSLFEDTWGGIDEASLKLTQRCGMTLFGVYLCHQPCRCQQRIADIHTTLLLRSGKDPPK